MINGTVRIRLFDQSSQDISKDRQKAYPIKTKDKAFLFFILWLMKIYIMPNTRDLSYS